MKKHLFLVWLLGLFFGLTAAAEATPFFARTYHMACSSCHDGYPRLNAFGRDFKANGFRIPGAEKSAPLAWQKTIPLAVQIVPTLERFSPGAQEAQFTDTQLLAGGLLTRTTSFYVHHSLWIDDKPLEFPSYEVWVQQVLDERSKLMLKAGQFELPFAVSPQTHQTTVFTPLLYGAGIQGNDLRMGAPMRGLQLSGLASKSVRVYVAAGAPSLLSTGNTVGEREFLGEFPNYFVRVASADPSRQIGAFAYLSRASRNPLDPSSKDDGQRYGIDGTITWRGIQFDGMAVYGENSNPLGDGHRGTLIGGFIEADKMLRPWVGVALRWDVQSIGLTSNTLYSDAKTVSVRFYPLPKRGLRLNAEYQQADHGRSSTALSASLSF